jgi:hypothetical protein
LSYALADTTDPLMGGDALGDRLDIVTYMSGLGAFDEEYANSVALNVDGIPIRVLPLERIVVSKRASGRPKDLAALPALDEALAAVREKR